MDRPTKRQVKIGNVVIGLIGVDVAINTLLAEPTKERQAAIAQLFEAVARQNYIPAGQEELYRQALTAEFDRLQRGEEESHSSLTIRILGPGCVSCNTIQKTVFEIMNRLGIAADIFQVHELDEIWRFGVLQTPALLINDQLKSSGRIPTSSQIEAWLREAADL